MAIYPTIRNGYLRYGSDGWPMFGESESSVVEDFEHQSLADYGDDTDAFRIQGTNVLQGRYSLEGTVAQRTIGASEADRPTPRGTDSDPIEYKCRMVFSDSGQASLLTNAQSADSPWHNCYGVLVDEGNDRIRLFRRENDNSTYHANISVGVPLYTGTEYRPAITVSGTGLKATLYDASDSVLVETDTYTDQTFTGGGLGWHNGIGTTTYFDYATSGSGSIGDTAQMVEDFESGDLSGYWIRDTSGSANVSPTASYSGSYGLEMDGFSEIQTTPGDGRPGYIQSGDPILFRINPRVLSDQQYWVPFCQSSHSSLSNRYVLQFIMGGGFRIQKVDSSGNSSTVPGSSSEGRDYAALYNLSYSADMWYTGALLADQADGLAAELYDAGGNRVGWISSPESEYVDAENGYGFRCSGSGRVFFDEMREF